VCIEVVPLARRPDLAAVIGRWHWERWGSGATDGSLESWTSRVASWANAEAIPSVYVALVDGQPAGSASLVPHDLPERTELWDLWPWLSGVYVVPDHRGRGVARALVASVEEAARRLTVLWLYLYTESAQGLYKRLGWESIGTHIVDGRATHLMAKLVGSAADARAEETAWLAGLRPSRVRDVQGGATAWTLVDVINLGAGTEAGAVRAVLESFRARVSLIQVGQPRHLAAASRAGDNSSEWVVLCCHSDDGRIVLPDLAPQVERFQHWHGAVLPDKLVRHVQVPGRNVVCTGCGTGTQELAGAFFAGGGLRCLAPAGAPFGYAGVMVVALVFYELAQRRGLDDAVTKLRSIDDEPAMWRLFRPPEADPTTSGATP
jgi:GNAT superfamily N-acetyltransferase